jgi:hypothetical protein
MKVRFTASEFLEIAIEEQKVPIQHYLRQPQRLVEAIANPTLMDRLSPERYRLRMRPLNFMEIYRFQPIVVLKVWAGASGIVYLNSEECEIKGIEYINERFFLNVKGRLSPCQKNGKTYLVGKADLEVKVELPPALWFTPRPLLEVAGNGLLKSVLLRIKQKLLTQLLQDYQHWANSDVEEVKSVSNSTLSTAENPIA